MMIRNEVDKYATHFNELARMVPHIVFTDEKRVDRYIWGLVPEIRRMVTSSNPITLQAAVGMAYRLTNNVVRSSGASKGNDSGRNRHEDQRRNQGRDHQDKRKRVTKNYGVTGHFSRNYQRGEEINRRKPTCYECGRFDPLKNVYPKLNRAPNNNNNNNAAKSTGPSLFSLEFRPLLDQKSECLKESYTIEYANDHEYEAGEILADCGEPLIVQGEKLVRDLKIVLDIKMYKYLEKECFAFLVHVVEKDMKVKLIQDIPIVRDYPKVFPDDLLGLPPPRKVEFQIDLIPGATLVARRHII
uniref:Ty3 transposon capsid-like protein domain-containing protein n=1 Tax=Tanacetum cinerariifolium TaxID=118510 RepID=A0A6L2NZX9_TANCI|nr:hypothetical protein [Tanacetum cinerariifolium]